MHLHQIYDYAIGSDLLLIHTFWTFLDQQEITDRFVDGAAASEDLNNSFLSLYKSVFDTSSGKIFFFKTNVTCLIMFSYILKILLTINKIFT